jgi:hypothetical protein
MRFGVSGYTCNKEPATFFDYWFDPFSRWSKLKDKGQLILAFQKFMVYSVQQKKKCIVFLSHISHF